MACFASVHGVSDLGREIWIIGDLERDKSIRWMPWHQEAMKDVARCEKPWGAREQALIRGYPNGATPPQGDRCMNT